MNGVKGGKLQWFEAFKPEVIDNKACRKKTFTFIPTHYTLKEGKLKWYTRFPFETITSRYGKTLVGRSYW